MMNRLGAQRPYTPPEAVLDIFTREFESAYAKRGLFLLTMHPHVTGYRSRIFILKELLGRIAGKGDCWIATHAQIARYCAEQAGPSFFSPDGAGPLSTVNTRRCLNKS